MEGGNNCGHFPSGAPARAVARKTALAGPGIYCWALTNPLYITRLYGGRGTHPPRRPVSGISEVSENRLPIKMGS
jgi:hypothetical protein